MILSSFHSFFLYLLLREVGRIPLLVSPTWSSIYLCDWNWSQHFCAGRAPALRGEVMCYIGSRRLSGGISVELEKYRKLYKQPPTPGSQRAAPLPLPSGLKSQQPVSNPGFHGGSRLLLLLALSPLPFGLLNLPSNSVSMSLSGCMSYCTHEYMHINTHTCTRTCTHSVKTPSSNMYV